MNICWSAAIGLLTWTLPYRILAYYPFRNQLRFPIWIVGLLIASSQIVEMLLYGHAISIGGSGRIVEFSFAVVCMVIYFSCIRADKFKVLFLYLFIIDYIMITRGLTAFITARLSFPVHMDVHSVASILIHLALFTLTAPLMLLFFKRTKKRIFQTEAPAFWRTIWLIPAFTSLIVLIFTGGVTPEQVGSYKFLLVRLFLLLSVFVVYAILLQSLDTIRSKAALTQQTQFQRKSLPSNATSMNT